MKKLFSLILTCVLLITMSVRSYAETNVISENSSEFSFYNEEGDVITVITSHTDTLFITKVFNNGILTQKSIGDAVRKSIETEIYDLSATDRSLCDEQQVVEDGFTMSVIHLPISAESINISDVQSQSRALVSEPVENTGLSVAAYFDTSYSNGYTSYSLGYYNGVSSAPDVYAELCRGYNEGSNYDGESRHYKFWDAGTAMSAIMTFYGMMGGPINAIISILAFAAQECLEYSQAIELATYTFDYWYNVRVNLQVCFTTTRNITYWKVENTTAGTQTWEQKSFNAGFAGPNEEIVITGIGNYLQSNQ